MSLWTLEDQVFYLTDYLGGSNDGKDSRDAYRAAVDGLAQLVNAHRWSYLYTPNRLVTVEPYSTGTVTFDYAGGLYERMLTLASGTWPAWARLGVICIDSVYYQVDERKSDTVITLQENATPQEDLAAGTEYELTQDTYALPSDLSAIHGMIDASSRVEIYPIPIEQWMTERLMYSSTGDPYSYTVCRDENYLDTQAVKFSPTPGSQRNVDYVYYRRFRDPRTVAYYGPAAGIVSVTAGSRVATFSGGTVIKDKHLGCALRLSDSTVNRPTGNAGDNPFEIERVITEVTNSDSVIVDTAFTDTLSSVKFYISDIIDIDQSSMLQAYKWSCRKWIANDRRMQNLSDIVGQYVTELKIAMGADAKMFNSEAIGGTGGLINLLANSRQLSDFSF